jgi:Fic family protein
VQPVGTTWLVQHFGLGEAAEGDRSYLGGRRQQIIKPSGAVDQVFTKSYWPGDHPLDHVEFALKYDSLSLDILEQVFRRLNPAELDQFIAASPTSKYRRRIGFLYEFLTPNRLKTAIDGNFVPILDPKKYFSGSEIRNARWNVVDNLLGSAGACPTVRRTAAIERKLKHDWPAEIRRLTVNTAGRQWNRAVSYLYLKETKASFAIEREEPSPERSERFVAVLAQSGKVKPEELLNEQRLTHLQNIIVDPRWAEKGFRSEQNFVGQTLPNFEEKVHYVCPPPELVRTLIAGLRSFYARTKELPAPLRAAVTSFGFVYIHPFKDGNGRIHRLLLHDCLALDGYTDAGVILPFSSVMLRDGGAYDRILETVSNIVNRRVRFHLTRDRNLVIENAAEADNVWRYPDYTSHVEYVLDLIETTVRHDLPHELDILEKIDRVTTAIKEEVDLPDRKLASLLSLLRSNGGKLSARKRASAFPELTDEEIRGIEEAYRSAFAGNE